MASGSERRSGGSRIRRSTAASQRGLRSVESFNGHPILVVSNTEPHRPNNKRGAALNSISDGEERRNDG